MFIQTIIAFINFVIPQCRFLRLSADSFLCTEPLLWTKNRRWEDALIHQNYSCSPCYSLPLWSVPLQQDPPIMRLDLTKFPLASILIYCSMKSCLSCSQSSRASYTPITVQYLFLSIMCVSFARYKHTEKSHSNEWIYIDLVIVCISHDYYYLPEGQKFV